MCMKTINIPDDLHKKIKLRAVKDDTTVLNIVLSLLEEEFGKSHDQGKSRDQKNVEKIMGKRKNAV